MATIDLGKISFVNKGTWSSSTAYTEKDVVQYTDNGILSSYVAVAGSTNQAPSTSGTANSSYWNYLAKGGAQGAAGSGGDSFNLSNNQIALKDAGGNLGGLSIGTAGQVLTVNSGASGYEFATPSSGGGGGNSFTGVGEEHFGTVDFTTASTTRNGIGNRNYYEVHDSNMFSSTYPHIKVVLEGLSTTAGLSGTSAFGIKFGISTNGGSQYDTFGYGHLMGMGRQMQNGSGSTHYGPSGASFELSSSTAYNIPWMEFVLYYDNVVKWPAVRGWAMYEAGGLSSSSASYLTETTFMYVGRTGQYPSGGNPNSFMIAQNSASGVFNYGKMHVFGLKNTF